MNPYRWIMAGPGFEGFGDEPIIWVMETLAAVFFTAVIYVIAKEFRLTMKHPPQKKNGLLYWISVRIIVVVGLLAIVESFAAIGLILFHSLTS